MIIAVEIAFSFKRELEADYRSLELDDDATVRSALEALALHHPRIQDRLFDDDGEVLRHINALVNGSNVVFRQGFDTVLGDGDRLTILPPAGGG